MELPFEYKNFAEFIKEERSLNNMSRNKLASKSGISLNMIERIENEKSVPTLSTIEAITNSLGFELCIKERDYTAEESKEVAKDLEDVEMEL